MSGESIDPTIKFNVCFILGGPGAGKGSVCELVVQHHKFVHLSAGELLRQAASTPGSPLGDEIQHHMKAGSIVPAKVTCGLLHEAMLFNYKSSGCINYLVDGFPRNEDNRTCWDITLGSKTELKQVFCLDLPDDICVKRCMGRGGARVDDNEVTLKRRLQQFKVECQPIIDYYEVRNLVSHIDASKSLEEVYDQVDHVLVSLDL